MGPYFKSLIERLDIIDHGIHEHLEELHLRPSDVGRNVLSELFGTACQSQNEANITLGRKAISRISHDWLLKVAPDVIDSTLDLADSWEHRRLLEVLSLSAPELLPIYIQRGLTSEDADVKEAAEDFS